MPVLLALLFLAADAHQQEELPAGRSVRSFSGAVHADFAIVRAGIQLFGSAGDALSQDPLREEDFLAPEFAWFVSPRWTLRAQLSKALRAGSGDQALLTTSWSF